MKKYLTAKSFTLTIATAIVILFSLVGCSSDTGQKLDQRNWELTWSDEFDGTSGMLPDAKKWTYDIGNGGWGNQELQYYTNRPENVSLDGVGNLVITAKNESLGGSAFTSARVKTQGLYTQAYGRFEARIKSPYGPGIWPAFWMLGANIDTTPWPQCGEIDIMEIKGNQPSIVYGTLHGPGYSGGNAITDFYALMNNRFDKDFHIFAVEWDADKIDFFVDGYLYQRLTKSTVSAEGEWVFNQPFYMIMNIAVGGTFVGFPTVDTSFPQKMTIDYVRVYKLAE
ncbi:glycoside hydrolase family 16 protein [Flavobacterium nackdongense]|uniref:Glycoside hydrolase family 16 protein n=1 Tax=Flavobacterium nackdongense TaxID=2547394 RepID=A0A4P6Y6P2_9FLAO|nr:glycoside hydrolase family 16 protein [Flavobacterium nackdongense]QBN18066.1 glycoside hydrolase family 16 protein [Flavobacterium nackdongense]